MLRSFSAFALFVAVGFVVGCQGKNAPAPDGSAQEDKKPEPRQERVPSTKRTPPAEPRPKPVPEPKLGPGPSVSKPTDEDPEVAAYFKSKGWGLGRDIRLGDGKPLVFLTVKSPAPRSADDCKMIARSKSLNVVNLMDAKVTDDALKIIATSPRMESIVLNGEEITNEGVKALAGCKTLDFISLFSTKKVTDDGIKELAALPNLRTLYLAFFTLNGSAFEAFAGSKALTSLTLEYIDGFTDDGARHLSKLPNLNELKIKSGFGDKGMTAAGLKAIVDVRVPAKFEFDKKLIDDAMLETLVAKGWLYGPTAPGAKDKKPATPEEVRSINLDDSRVTDKGFAAVLNCTNAESLFLGRTGISDETLRKLAGFKKLKYLALEKTKVTGTGLEALTALPIDHVAMQECELTEAAFQALGKMPELKELWISGAKMKADWLKHLTALPKFKELNLMRTDFNDDAVNHLMKISSLEDLTLNNTGLTDVGFQQLLKLPKLKRLYVDSTKVSKEVYLKAKKDHPKVSFYFYRYDS